ncbi:hypothetical protein [Nocardia heshunensis]
MRIAAVGDIHLSTESQGLFRLALADLGRARGCAEEFGGLDVPVMAVLGNHDHHGDVSERIAETQCERGVLVHEGSTVTVDVGECSLAPSASAAVSRGIPVAHSANN